MFWSVLLGFELVFACGYAFLITLGITEDNRCAQLAAAVFHGEGGLRAIGVFEAETAVKGLQELDPRQRDAGRDGTYFDTVDTLGIIYFDVGR